MPSLIEPYWYGDEGIYAVIGQSLRDGAVLYKDIWDNKPPVLYLLYAAVNGELLWIKGMSLIFGAATVFAIFKLAEKLLKDKRAVIVSVTVFTFLFGLPILEGNIANAENFMLLPLSVAFYFILRNGSVTTYIAAGLLISLAAMIKIVAVFDLAAILFIMALMQIKDKRAIKSGLISFINNKKTLGFILGVLFIPLLVFIYYLNIQAVQYLLSSVFTNNVGYVGVNNYFLFPLGLILLKIIILVAALTTIFIFRKALSREEIVIYSWLAFGLFSVFFSDRPYIHYLLMGLLPFSLLVGYLIKRPRTVSVLVIAVIIVLSQAYFSVYKKNIKYYINFAEYVFADKSFREYTAFFDRNSVIDYDIAGIMRTIMDKQDSVYYWSDSAQLYLLTGVRPFTKYIVAYHNLGYEEALAQTSREIQEKRPKYIVSTKNMPIYFNLLDEYELKYTIESARIYEKRL